MSLINTKAKKNFWTPEQDQLVVKLKNEGKTAKQIAAEAGHTEASVVYRITRKLSRVDDFSQIKYKTKK
jgi:DNA-binding NarL/FixJ family response regulator